MSTTISITETQIFTALRTVLLTFGFSGSPEIVRGQVNRVPSPLCPDYIVMWPLGRPRIGTNFDTYNDCQIVGSITDNALNVTSVTGTVSPGTFVYSESLPGPILIINQTDGPIGGVGYYQVQNSPNIISQLLYVGSGALNQPTEMTIQCDVHGPCSGDNAQKLSTLFRDYYAISQFQLLPYDITPLYSEEPHQIPFINDQDQYEERWVVDLKLQINATTTVTQQFADVLVIKTIEAD